MTFDAFRAAESVFRSGFAFNSDILWYNLVKFSLCIKIGMNLKNITNAKRSTLWVEKEF